METKVHKFEAAGLGKAPFSYAGYAQKTYQACPGAPVQPGGSCCYCGTPIMNFFYIKSSDGHTFHVGSECVAKTGDAGLKKVVAAEVAKMAKSKEEVRIAAAKAKLESPEFKAHLASLPHPNKFKNRETGEPLTMLEYVEWMFKNSGHAGSLKVARQLEKLEAAHA